MSEFKRENPTTELDELLDGPQPGFRRYTQKELGEMALEDKARLDLLADHFGGDAQRDIDPNIVLGQD